MIKWSIGTAVAISICISSHQSVLWAWEAIYNRFLLYELKVLTMQVSIICTEQMNV